MYIHIYIYICVFSDQDLENDAAELKEILPQYLRCHFRGLDLSGAVLVLVMAGLGFRVSGLGDPQHFAANVCRGSGRAYIIFKNQAFFGGRPRERLGSLTGLRKRLMASRL